MSRGSCCFGYRLLNRNRNCRERGPKRLRCKTTTPSSKYRWWPVLRCMNPSRGHRWARKQNLGSNIHIFIGLKERPPRLVCSKIVQVCETNDWINQVRNKVFWWLIQRRIRGWSRLMCVSRGRAQILRACASQGRTQKLRTIISRPILLVCVINAGLIHSRSQTHGGTQFKVVTIKMKWRLVRIRSERISRVIWTRLETSQ